MLSSGRRSEVAHLHHTTTSWYSGERLLQTFLCFTIGAFHGVAKENALIPHDMYRDAFLGQQQTATLCS